MAAKNEFVAVDVGFLLALAQGSPAAQELIDFFISLRFFVAASEAITTDLYDTYDRGEEPEKTLAYKALSSLSSWSIYTPGIQPVNRGIAHFAAQELLNQKLVHDYRLAYAIAEAAGPDLSATWFLSPTFDMDSNANSLKISAVLNQRGCHPTRVVSPELISTVYHELLA